LMSGSDYCRFFGLARSLLIGSPNVRRRGAMSMVSKKRVPEAKQNLRPAMIPKPPEAGPTRSDVRELAVGRRSLRDAVLLLARKLEEELGVDVSDVTEMLGVCTGSDAPRAEIPDPDIFERDTVDMARPVPKAGGDSSDR